MPGMVAGDSDRPRRRRLRRLVDYTLRSSAEDEVDVRQFFAQHTTAVPKDPGELVEFFADAAGTWLAEARRTDPAKPTWTFKGPGRADFWFGRASTECAVHRWDAEGAFGDAPTVAAERASDGITETLDALLRPRVGLPLPAVPMGLVPDDRPDRWIVVPAADGFTRDETASAGVTLRGDASSLFLFLHGRSSGTVEISDTGDGWCTWEPYIRAYAG